MAGLPKPSFLTVNPPYVKLDKSSELSKIMTANDIPVPNLYAAFIALGASWLEDNEHLLCIIPRSFCSGDYFQKFRRWLGQRMSVEHIILYRSRTNFKNVLQESILCYMTKTPHQSERIRITIADTPTSAPEYDLVMSARDIISEDCWCLPGSANDIELINQNRRRNHTLRSLGVSMTTGKIELHRLKGDQEIPVIYSKDFTNAGEWVWNETRKPRMVLTQKSRILNLPKEGGYVILKRISSNSDKNPNRLFPAWLSQSTTGYSSVGVDNHIHYLSLNDQPLSEQQGRRLIEFLKSEEAQAIMRATAGTTQINEADLHKLHIDDIFQSEIVETGVLLASF
jgi:adenine-specific DNA-methyltransferase